MNENSVFKNESTFGILIFAGDGHACAPWVYRKHVLGKLCQCGSAPLTDMTSQASGHVPAPDVVHFRVHKQGFEPGRCRQDQVLRSSSRSDGVLVVGVRHERLSEEKPRTRTRAARSDDALLSAKDECDIQQYPVEATKRPSRSGGSVKYRKEEFFDKKCRPDIHIIDTQRTARKGRREDDASERTFRFEVVQHDDQKHRGNGVVFEPRARSLSAGDKEERLWRRRDDHQSIASSLPFRHQQHSLPWRRRDPDADAVNSLPWRLRDGSNRRAVSDSESESERAFDLQRHLAECRCPCDHMGYGSYRHLQVLFTLLHFRLNACNFYGDIKIT